MTQRFPRHAQSSDYIYFRYDFFKIVFLFNRLFFHLRQARRRHAADLEPPVRARVPLPLQRSPDSSLGLARMPLPSITHGRWSAQAAAPPLAQRTSFIWWCSLSSLHHSFGLRVEGHSGYMFHAVLGTPLSPRDGCELLYPSVRRDDGRHAIAGPPSDQGVHNGHCG